jgi:hypothetical protein
MVPDSGRPRPPRCSPAEGGGDVRGSDATVLRFKLDTIELTFPPPRRGREPRGGRARDASAEVTRESDARLGFSGASSLWETAGEGLRSPAPPASGEEEFDGERTRGVLVRIPGRGEPLLRRVGVGGETLTGAATGTGAGTGAGDSRSDSGGGEVKAGRGGTSSSSGGGDLKVGRAGMFGFAAGAAGIGTGATTRGGSGAGVGLKGGGGGTTG